MNYTSLASKDSLQATSIKTRLRALLEATFGRSATSRDATARSARRVEATFSATRRIFYATCTSCRRVFIEYTRSATIATGKLFESSIHLAAHFLRFIESKIHTPKVVEDSTCWI